MSSAWMLEHVAKKKKNTRNTLYLYIFFLMAVNILRQLSVLESMDARNDQQDGGQHRKIHLLKELDLCRF